MAPYTNESAASEPWFNPVEMSIDAVKDTAAVGRDVCPPYGVPREPVYTVNQYRRENPDSKAASKKLMTCAVRKGVGAHTDDAMAGLKFAEGEDGNIYVASKTPSPFFSPFSAENLEVGDRVTGINGTTEFKSAGHAEYLFRRQVKRAALPNGAVEKDYILRDWAMAGISLKVHDGYIVVDEIHLTSPFKRHTFLRSGDRIYAINGVTHFKHLGDAEKLIRDADEVSIITDFHASVPDPSDYAPLGW